MRTGLLAMVLFFPAFAHAAALININTADATLLDTLPGIGPTYATRIVDYRTVHGPFVRIEDIQNVSGIGPSTFTDIKPFITVSDSNEASTPDTSVATSSPGTSTFAGGATTYVPPPSAISLKVNSEQNAMIEVPLRLSAYVTTKSGAADPSAHIVWSFGDGSGGEGSTAEKMYRYAGTYLVVVTASDGDATAQDDLSVTVKSATVRIAAVSGEGITLANESKERLDLSGWRLSADTGFFRLPAGTMLLPNASVLFPYSIINLPVSLDAMLLYPDGVIAARYTPPAPLVTTTMIATTTAQLSASAISYNQVQAVEPIISTRTNVQSYEKKAVNAPAAATELAVAGAALESSPEVAAPAATSRIAEFLHSSWILSLLGVVSLAGGAFVLL